MISIVLVSHSRTLAEGLLELLRQVTPPGAQIAQAAGVGPDHTEIGTDAAHIAEVIQAVFSTDGVLVLMDLGSAVLSAGIALELLPEEMRPLVCLCPAAFVEGALAAAVQAGLGGELQTVCLESQKALASKLEQLSSAVNQPSSQGKTKSTAASAETGVESSELRVVIRNPHGLHLRPAARFVQAAAGYQAEVRVWNQSGGSGPASAKSINALAMLNVRHGDEIKISASGPEAEMAIHGLEELVRQNFGEAMEKPAGLEEAASTAREVKPPDEAHPETISGIPIATGAAVAPLYHLKREIIAVEGGQAENPQAEWNQLEQALQRVNANLQKRQAALQQRFEPGRGSGSAGSSSGEIFFAHRLILEDPEFIEQVRRRVYQEGLRAASAWAKEIRQLAERYRGLADVYMTQRAVDIEDVGSQVLTELAGKTTLLKIPGSAPVILYAQELTPLETAQLDPSRVAGLVTALGTGNSHSAILARALGIPAVSGIEWPIEAVPDGTLLALDGDLGKVWVDPPAEVLARYTERTNPQAPGRQARLPAILKNGRRIEVLANIGSPTEAKLAAAQGAEGVGLLRTEFLFLSRAQAPAEEEQAAALRAICQAFDGRPVVVRTLDAGGDKDLPYLKPAEGANPFLGVRAIRLALRHPALFQTQLRAILRAAEEYPLQIMFPMIASMRDLHQALEQLETAHASLTIEGVPHRWPVETGMMVEVPSAALLSELFAPLVDFFSIGTNDLTQYTLAADRGSQALAEYQDALHPAVLKLIQQVARNGKRFGKPVGVCGELAGDPLAVPVLIGLGVDELSMNAAAIPRVKETIRKLDEASVILLAERAVQMDSAASVRKEVRAFLEAIR